jgi:hypothetical protein
MWAGIIILKTHVKQGKKERKHVKDEVYLADILRENMKYA